MSFCQIFIYRQLNYVNVRMDWWRVLFVSVFERLVVICWKFCESFCIKGSLCFQINWGYAFYEASIFSSPLFKPFAKSIFNILSKSPSLKSYYCTFKTFCLYLPSYYKKFPIYVDFILLLLSTLLFLANIEPKSFYKKVNLW